MLVKFYSIGGKKMNERELTEQEEFWMGEFGDQYTVRNNDPDGNTGVFEAVKTETRSVVPTIKSVIEFGANRGLNIVALKKILPNAKFTAVEINESACEILQETGATVVSQSLLDYKSGTKFDLAIVRGVLIHLNPKVLDLAYEIIASSSARYVLISEYYNPVPVGIDYRGQKDRLFKRDFAGEFMQLNQEFNLIDYGFHYRNGHYFGDDQTWFLMERKPI
jgi:pseudaminic acid biosynthesis-associated methylase